MLLQNKILSKKMCKLLKGVFLEIKNLFTKIKIICLYSERFMSRSRAIYLCKTVKQREELH